MKILVINGTVWKAEGDKIESIIKNSGHELVTDTKTNVSALLLKLEGEFPDVYAAIKTGIATLKDSSIPGGQKAIQVAEEALAIAPAVIKDLPGIKDALVGVVTTFFASEVSDFKTVTAETIAGLSAAVAEGVAGTTAAVAAPAAASTSSTNTTTAG